MTRVSATVAVPSMNIVSPVAYSQKRFLIAIAHYCDISQRIIAFGLPSFLCKNVISMTVANIIDAFLHCMLSSIIFI